MTQLSANQLPAKGSGRKTKRDVNREPLLEAVSLRPRLCFHLLRVLEIKRDGRDSSGADGLLSASSEKVTP